MQKTALSKKSKRIKDNEHNYQYKIECVSEEIHSSSSSSSDKDSEFEEDGEVADNKLTNLF